MQRLVVREFDRIPKAQFCDLLLQRLHRFDQAQASISGQSIFDWNEVRHIRVLSGG